MLETEDQAKYVMDMYYHNGKVEGLEEGRAEGKAEGIEEGRDSILKLNNILLNDKRYDDLAKASSNKDYLNQLLRQYGLI